MAEPGERECEADEFDEWENAGRYLPSMLYPTLRVRHDYASDPVIDRLYRMGAPGERDG